MAPACQNEGDCGWTVDDRCEQALAEANRRKRMHRTVDDLSLPPRPEARRGRRGHGGDAARRRPRAAGTRYDARRRPGRDLALGVVRGPAGPGVRRGRPDRRRVLVDRGPAPGRRRRHGRRARPPAGPGRPAAVAGAGGPDGVRRRPGRCPGGPGAGRRQVRRPRHGPDRRPRAARRHRRPARHRSRGPAAARPRRRGGPRHRGAEVDGVPATRPDPGGAHDGPGLAGRLPLADRGDPAARRGRTRRRRGRGDPLAGDLRRQRRADRPGPGPGPARPAPRPRPTLTDLRPLPRPARP
ncbi:hypothetical protein NOCARDAX2BIS_150035 [Nocardioides sp. AX2bis]|nr:hypothetical protein NOCARDAX2BIS_150035 [Nocardioides sp. AX2bis]